MIILSGFKTLGGLALVALLLGSSYLFYQAGDLAAFPAAPSNRPAMEFTTTLTEEDKPDKVAGIAIAEAVAAPSPPCEAVIIAVGDVMVHQAQFVQAYIANSKIYDFSPSFEYITPYLQASNLTVGNLETTLAGAERGYSAYPRFRSPDSLAQALRQAGFDLLCTANNHAMDSGGQGVSRTLEVIEEMDLKAFGTARTQAERDTPLLVETNGISLAFLAYTYGTNGIPLPGGRDYMVNLIDQELMYADIQHARKAGADLVIVYMHWGLEYSTEPSPEQKELARFLAAAGAHIIIGSHPHVIQPMEYISMEDENGIQHRTFVAYSLGNFISSQHMIPGTIPTHEVQYGMLLRLHLQRDTPGQAAYLQDVDYTLTWVDRSQRHRIIPLPFVKQGLPVPPFIPESKWPEIRETALGLQERLDGFSPGGFNTPHDNPTPLPCAAFNQ